MTEHWYWWLLGAFFVVAMIVGVLWLGDDPPDAPREDEPK